MLFVARADILEILAPDKANVENEGENQPDHKKDLQVLLNRFSHCPIHKTDCPKEVGGDHDQNDVKPRAASFSLFFRQGSFIDLHVTTL